MSFPGMYTPGGAAGAATAGMSEQEQKMVQMVHSPFQSTRNMLLTNNRVDAKGYGIMRSQIRHVRRRRICTRRRIWPVHV